MSVINTNVSAVIAQNALSVNERDMTTTMERLSTGKRINSAADDAAGLAIGARMSSQITGLTQAARNANDGVSMIQTAESAYVEVGDMLQRMRQIAVQSASETYATSDRTALDLEFQALQDEIVRISEQTTWNGFTLLDDSPGTNAQTGVVQIQSGANASQTVDVDFGNLVSKAKDSAGANVIADSVAGTALSTTASGSFTDTITAATTAAVASHAIAIANFGSLKEGDVLMFTVTENGGSTTHDVALTLSAAMVTDIGDTTAAAALDTTAVIEDGKTLTNIVGTGTGGADMGITVDSTATAGTITIAGLAADGTTAANGDFTISNMKVRRGHVGTLEIADVKTQTSANSAISLLDTAIQNVNDQRASYGSYISRLEHASDNLTSIATNTAQSRSRVVDANYATETTELARTQIIQQAATAMLAQANQMKQTVLALLQ